MLRFHGSLRHVKVNNTTKTFCCQQCHLVTGTLYSGEALDWLRPRATALHYTQMAYLILYLTL
jgi:hypothetical protein